VQTHHLNILEDVLNMKLFIGDALVHDEHEAIDIERTKKRVMHYQWKENSVYFKNLMVPKPKDRSQIIKKMHKEIGHFGEARTLSKIKQWFLWHDRTDSVKEFVKTCDKCQLTKQIGNLRSSVEGMKSILVCDLFYHVTLNIVGPLTKMFIGNKYLFIVVDHYFEWCEVHPIKEHDVAIVARFLEEEIICCFRVPKYISIDNGSE